MSLGIEITLTPYNMGEVEELDFDAWATFVKANIDTALGFEVDAVYQFPFKRGPHCDHVSGGTEDQKEAIRTWLSVDGWNAFCAAGFNA